MPFQKKISTDIKFIADKIGIDMELIFIKQRTKT